MKRVIDFLLLCMQTQTNNEVLRLHSIVWMIGSSQDSNNALRTEFEASYSAKQPGLILYLSPS